MWFGVQELFLVHMVLMGLSDRRPPPSTEVILILIPQKAEPKTGIVWEVIPENTVKERGSEKREEK